ncbi:CDP-diacylglycerol--serine O-phosphatidyltransferase [Acidobacteria bacterium AH-259-G07]|nr:CDP-diacylglycerol--serine O-phosphatidyltransferase [Acidobacteria bacterium AH-259-G07]
MTLKEKEHLEREAELVFNPRRKLRRSVYLLPSVFTVGTIFAGFYAVISTLNGHYESAAVAIGIAVVLDGLDGRVARLANATSDFGLQLDSLADVISFGIAPAILIYSWGLGEFGKFARFSTFVFLICGAMRLARFNVQLKDLKHFAGLPIPAGAGFVAATVHLFGEPPDSLFFKFYLVGITYLISFLMLSTIRYPSLKQLNLGRGKSHLNVLMLALLVAGVIWYSQQVLMVIATVYLCSGLFTRVYQFVKYRIRSQGLPTKELNID